MFFPSKNLKEAALPCASMSGRHWLIPTPDYMQVYLSLVGVHRQQISYNHDTGIFKFIIFHDAPD